MFDQEYEWEDLGFTYIVSPLGEIVTDPGFKAGEWFVKHTDEKGLFIIDLEHELAHWAGNDPVWDTAAKAVFNSLETVVMIFPVGKILKEWNIITLLHSSVAYAYSDIKEK